MRLRCGGRIVALLVGLAAPVGVAGQQGTGSIRGEVVDSATARPLSGTQVSIPGTGLGTLTDERGAFLITNVPAGVATVEAQMIGYATLDEKIAVKPGEVASLAFHLSEQAVSINRLVVTATGERREREIGNAVATIDLAKIPVAPVKGVQGMMNGEVAGVYMMANSGQPGAGGTIRLRGNNSVAMGNNPIVYVDGVRVYSGLSPTMPYNRQGTLPLNDISPDDIARIEIVKGPAATTLYGTEASSGVIQIFTKQGRTGAPRWDAQISAGFNNQGHVGSSSDPTGMWLNECSGAGLVTGNGTIFQDPTCPSSGSWLRNGPIQKIDLSVRGGQSQMSYYISGNYNRTDGTLQNSWTRDAGFRANFGFRPVDKVDLRVSSSYTRRNTSWVPDGNSADGVLLNVSRGPYGNFKGSGCTDPNAVCVNNGDIFQTNNTTKSDHYITGITLSYSPGTWLVNRLTFGYDYNDLVNQNISPFGFVRVPLGQLYWDNWVQKLITVDYASTLQNSFGKDFSSAFSVGAQMFDNRLEDVSVTASDFAGPGDPTMVSAASRTVTGDTRQRVVNAGFFVQEVVGWKERAYLTGGLRVDGNSAFGRSFGLQPYPKVSASYILSDHGFWPKNLIQTFKLRAAVGESGKAPGAFDAVRTWDPIAGNNGQPGFTPAQLGNPDLGPERTLEYEAGFEASALDGRLGVDFTAFEQHTSDALIPVTAPPSDGFLSTQLENVGKLKNSGIELNVTGTMIQTDNLEWDATFNYSTAFSKAVNLDGNIFTVSSNERTYVEEGYPVPAYIGKVVTNPNAYADPIIKDNTFIGSPYPNRIIGLSSTVRLFNRITASALGQWELGGYLMNAVGYQNSAKGTWYGCYAAQAKLNAFAAGDTHALDDVTALQRVKCSQKTGVRDYDWWIEPDNYFKLRNVTLSYDLPHRLALGARSATLILSGQNLLTVTKYDGTDPEVADQRDSMTGRRDYYVFPQPRTFLLSLRVSF